MIQVKIRYNQKQTARNSEILKVVGGTPKGLGEGLVDCDHSSIEYVLASLNRGITSCKVGAARMYGTGSKSPGVPLGNFTALAAQ